MTVKLTNNASSPLSASITDTDTSVSITSGDEGDFPTLGAGEWFPLTVFDESGNREVMRCTARSGITLTVMRGQEGTTALNFTSGARAAVRLTAAAVAEFLQAPVSNVSLAAMTGGHVKGRAQGAADGEVTDLTGAQLWAILDAAAAGRGAQAGDVKIVAASSPPAGWIKANGATLSRTTYAALWAFAQTSGNLAATQGAKQSGQFGPGDGSTTFTIPDLRGRFIRPWDDGRGVDSGRAIGTDQASQNKAHNHTGTTDQDGLHNHTGATTTAGNHAHFQVAGTSGGGAGSNILGFSTNGAQNIANLLAAGDHAHALAINNGGQHDHDFTTDDAGGSEARSENTALLAVIKY